MKTYLADIIPKIKRILLFYGGQNMRFQKGIHSVGSTYVILIF
jgi:hypothetical protein